MCKREILLQDERTTCDQLVIDTFLDDNNTRQYYFSIDDNCGGNYYVDVTKEQLETIIKQLQDVVNQG